MKRVKVFKGMTLLELILVVVILAVTAMMLLPRLDGVQSNANHAVGATTAADTAAYIQSYKTMKNRLPDGWDSLTDGTAMWAAANPGTTPVTRGLHTQLSGSGTNNKLADYSLSAADVTSLNSAGIYTLFNVNTSAATSVRPGDMFTVVTPVAAGAKVAIVNASSTGGRKIIDHFYRDNTLSTGTTGTLPSGRQLLALGFGPHNKLVGTMMLECPVYPNVDLTLVYGRNLALFEIGGTRALFKGVVGADGDLLDDLSASMNKDP